MADLTPELLERLEKIAKAATPGPWTNEKPPTEDGWQVGVTRGGMIFACPPSGQMPLADARHIAAASPDVVLALVADARKLAQIRALLTVEDDGPEGSLGPRWVLRQIQEVINGGT